MTESPRESELDLGVEDIVTSIRSLGIDPQHGSTNPDPETHVSTGSKAENATTNPVRPGIERSSSLPTWRHSLDELTKSAENEKPCKDAKGMMTHTPGKGEKMSKSRHQAKARKKALDGKGKKKRLDRRQKKRRRAARGDRKGARMKGFSGAMAWDVRDVVF